MRRLAGLLACLALVACGPSVVAAPAPPISPDAVERGRVLFRNKGCVTCHMNQREGGPPARFEVGPNLTNYRNDPAFLRRWLADPPAVKPNTEMPKLNLSEGEISDLIAFLNGPR